MADVVSLGDRLKQRRAELGISQAQAARELDVARTAYRLWEMEAAKPAPDRWRLLSRWLGVSVTTMLLADELITETEASTSTVTAVDFGRPGQGWDALGAAGEGDFFQQSRALIQEGLTAGSINDAQAGELGAVLDRLEEQHRRRILTAGWAPGELRKALPATPGTPYAARRAVAVLAGDIPSEPLQTAQLLTSELVTNSVKYGPPAPATVGLVVEVARDWIRVQVSDAADAPPQLRSPTEHGGYGLTLVDALADRWGTARNSGRNLTWFELDLPAPGMERSPQA
jgi:transcriptional regulator with XRE-family HTH domain/anti-sigma regulatory factor (Ser/Thr protein kinase)